MDAQYSMIVQASIAGYASKYGDVPKDQIKKVVEEHLTKKMLTQTMADVYAKNFDADELQMMIDANKHPETAMAKIMGSKDGMKLAQKAMQVQGELQSDMVKAFQAHDKDITEALDGLQEEARG
jgi:flagellar biosynthesis/type III secretory pathway protein FliH